MPIHIQNRLEYLFQNSRDFEELSELAVAVFALMTENFVVIDAIDECDMKEREMLLCALQGLTTSPQVKLKVFLASGSHIGVELKQGLKIDYQLSMACPELHSDIR